MLLGTAPEALQGTGVVADLHDGTRQLWQLQSCAWLPRLLSAVLLENIGMDKEKHWTVCVLFLPSTSLFSTFITEF
jgi:hypothetical protein